MAVRTQPQAIAGGRYEVLGFLGEGARKVVYRAHDAVLDRDVAVALIGTAGLDKAGRDRILREARAMARLGSHPNIVTVHDFGEEDAFAYLVSELMERGSVADLAPPLPTEQTVRLAGQVCAALGHAHRAGLVHRDVKPANVFLNEDGEARLGDFGLALAVDRPRLTGEGNMVGTLDYMPPEQATGGPVDARSDLYALGAMLYELVCGRPPFRGDDIVAVVSQHIHAAPVAPSWHNAEVPPALEALILRLLAKAPDDRPDSADAVAGELEVLAAGPGAVPTIEESNPLGRLAQGAFVGRRAELERLRALIDDAVAGHGRLALVEGEAGIGKTRTVEEATAYAGLRGARVLWGRCHEADGAPAYWPWVQIVRDHLAQRPEEAWRAEMGEGAETIARVVPDVAAAIGEVFHPAGESPEQARFRFFEAMARFLAAAAAERPLVLVLDDLHWADPASLLLLSFLSRAVGRDRILIVATYRGAEAELGELDTEAAEWITLRGLDEDEVGRFIEARAGVSAGARLVHAAHERTEGNPFFLSEVVRLAASEGDFETVAVPEGVRQVLTHRLERLSDGARTVLTAAAVLGRDFGLEALPRVADMTIDRALDALDEATEAQVVAAGSAGRFRFAHALVRDTIYDELSAVQRMRLHLRAAEALEAAHGHAAELAHHWFEALHLAGAEKAVDYSVQAAERSHDALSFEESAHHYDRACRALELAGRPDDPRRIELLLRRGDERTHAGEVGPSQESFRDAAQLARAQGLADLQARAALGYAQWSILGPSDPAIPMLEDALLALPETDSSVRAEVLSELAVHLEPAANGPRKDELSGAAVAMARRIGDRTLLALLLANRHAAIWGPDNLDERLAIADEGLALSLEARDRSRARWAHFLRFVNLLEAGEVPAADRALDEFARAADELGHPYHRWFAAFVRRTRALMDGRDEDAARLAAEAAELWETDDPENAWARTIQDMPRLAQQGRLVEVREAAVDAVAAYSSIPAYRCLLAWIDAATGREADTRRELDRLAADGFAALPRDERWLAAVVVLAHAAHALGDARHAPALAELLAPYGERWVLFDAGWACLGPCARPLGLLAELMDDHEAAAAHFARAAAMAEAAGAEPWLERRPRPTTSIEAMAMTIEAEQPARVDVAQAVPVTLMFSDIEGSTELTERLGDDRWLAVLEDHNAIIREAVAAHAGDEVKSQGDGFMLAFAGPRDALACAVAVQRALARRNADRPDCPVAVRMGLHCGPALRRGTDFFGRNVVVAARIAAQARGGEILVSGELFALVPGAEAEGEPCELALKGLRGTQRVHAVAWAPDSVVTEGDLVQREGL